MLHSTRISRPFAAIAVALLAACSEPSAPADEAPPPENLSITMAGMIGGMMPPEGGRIDGPCANGGTRTLEGSGTHNFSDDVASNTWLVTLTYRQCGMRVDTFTIVMDGVIKSQGRSRMRGVPTPGTRPTLLELEARDQGDMTTTINGVRRACSFDVTQTFIAATNQIRIKGVSCGHSIEFLRPA